MTKNIHVLLTSVFLVILGATTRLLPHPANVAPIAAIALFAGLYLPRKFALIVPLLTMFLSDAVIGFYHWPMMVAVYAGFALMIYFGTRINNKKTLGTIASATLLGSIIFFVLTNAAVWAFGTMYVKTFSGLLQSYTMALPFFRNSLIGDFFFVTILVGTAEIAERLQAHHRALASI